MIQIATHKLKTQLATQCGPLVKIVDNRIRGYMADLWHNTDFSSYSLTLQLSLVSLRLVSLRLVNLSSSPYL